MSQDNDPSKTKPVAEPIEGLEPEEIKKEDLEEIAGGVAVSIYPHATYTKKC